MKRTSSKIRIIHRENRNHLLDDLSFKIRECHKCIDGDRACGFGDPISGIVLIGQSLHRCCRETPRQQIPFIGPMHVDSGDVLFKAIEEAGRRVEDLWITNIVKCHPNSNAPNKVEWVDSCFSFLERELAIIKPEYIICLGKQAKDGLLTHLSSPKRKVGEMFRRVLIPLIDEQVFEAKLVSITHPSWAMRNGDETTRSWIKEFRDLLRSLPPANFD